MVNTCHIPMHVLTPACKAYAKRVPMNTACQWAWAHGCLHVHVHGYGHVYASVVSYMGGYLGPAWTEPLLQLSHLGREGRVFSPRLSFLTPGRPFGSVFGGPVRSREKFERQVQLTQELERLLLKKDHEIARLRTVLGARIDSLRDEDEADA
jgi:hypothetical protein